MDIRKNNKGSIDYASIDPVKWGGLKKIFNGDAMLTLSIIQENTNITDDTRGYRYNIRINYKVIASGKVKGHHRELGWEALVQQILDERRENEKKD